MPSNTQAPNKVSTPIEKFISRDNEKFHQLNFISSVFFPGTTKPNEIEDFKNHMVSRLATAYNLEKMRKTLAKLRESRERNQHLDNNEITDSSDDSRVASLKTEKAKRIAVKKEKVEYDNTQ